MSEPQSVVFQEIISKLESLGVPYMIVGSIASMIYGEPRLTNDMDVVLEVKELNARKFSSSFPSPQYFCPPEEILSSEFSENGYFNVLHQNSGFKIDFIVRKNSEHSQIEFRRRRKIPLWNNFEAFIASPEDIILKKLSYYREGLSEKHLRDIRGILAQTEIDKNYLEQWLTKLKLTDEWDKI